MGRWNRGDIGIIIGSGGVAWKDMSNRIVGDVKFIEGGQIILVIDVLKENLKQGNVEWLHILTSGEVCWIMEMFVDGLVKTHPHKQTKKK